jgi:hypothetical protein
MNILTTPHLPPKWIYKVAENRTADCLSCDEIMNAFNQIECHNVCGLLEWHVIMALCER